MEEQILIISKNIMLKRLFLCIVFVLPCFLLYAPSMENDTYWLINTGKYIMNNGLPTMEPFTIHSGLAFNAQQWLAEVIFYKAYDLFGEFGIHFIDITVYLILCVIIYRLTLLISLNNKLIQVSVSVFSCIFLSFYIVPRPQIFSIIIFALVILLLELYIKNKSKIILICLPVLSVLLVNLHSAMWIFLFLIYIPYIIDGIKFKLWKIETQGYKISSLITVSLISIAVGLINPYGYKNMLYVIYSYGNKMVNSSINEMQSPDFKGAFGVIVFGLLLVFVLIHVMVNGKTRLRYALITIGTIYMGLSSVRSLALFFACSLPFLAYYLKEVNFTSGIALEAKKRAVIAFAIVAVLVAAVFLKKYDYTDSMNEFRPIGAVEFIKKNVQVDKMRLYNDYNTGGYIEFEGLKTFIDSRAEIFLKSLNKKDDIILDYINMRKGSLYYKKFISKYGFTHYLMSKSDPLYVFLKEDNNYKKVYEDKEFVVYKNLY
ncbi:MAG: hypothetical protein Q8942_07605 [Bacillota bacterium]|nr:hypothetical protein [Bacillota bacterium]